MVPATPSRMASGRLNATMPIRMKRKLTERVANTIGKRTFRPEVRG